MGQHQFIFLQPIRTQSNITSIVFPFSHTQFDTERESKTQTIMYDDTKLHRHACEWYLSLQRLYLPIKFNNTALIKLSLSSKWRIILAWVWTIACGCLIFRCLLFTLHHHSHHNLKLTFSRFVNFRAIFAILETVSQKILLFLVLVDIPAHFPLRSILQVISKQPQIMRYVCIPKWSCNFNIKAKLANVDYFSKV